MSESVVIIGAGAAGLSCAADLARTGIAVTVLEARDRVGGRIFSQSVQGLPAPVELGAEFIHGEAPQIFDSMKQAGQEIIEGTGDDWCREEGELCACDFFEKVDELLNKMKQHGYPDRSFAEFLKELPREQGDEHIRLRALDYVSGFNAADPDKISVRSLIKDMARSEELGGERILRLRNGYSALVSWLERQCTSNRVEIRTDHAARRIAYGSDRAVITGNHFRETFQLEADAVVVTVPASLLHPGAAASITFDPELPTSKLEALRGTAFGAVIRVVLVFKEPFWKTMKGSGGSLARLRFLFSHDPFFPTWWTQHPVESPVLVAWSSGPRAKEFSGWTKQRIIEQALSSLANILPISRTEVAGMLREGFLHDWQADPFSLGAYSYLCVGAADAPAELARSMGNRVFFAGEATNGMGDHGTVHGAMESGQRAAAEIKAVLG
ncbi:MAG: flavin monoamine oxidase family protein [Terriglobales bacterium]|jgi:monoamine oxidase